MLWWGGCPVKWLIKCAQNCFFILDMSLQRNCQGTSPNYQVILTKAFSVTRLNFAHYILNFLPTGIPMRLILNMRYKKKHDFELSIPVHMIPSFSCVNECFPQQKHLCVFAQSDTVLGIIPFALLICCKRQIFLGSLVLVIAVSLAFLMFSYKHFYFLLSSCTTTAPRIAFA